MGSFQGHLLVASPELRDPNFFRTVLLILQHDENGAMGVVLNRPTEMSISEAWKQVSEIPCQIEAQLFQGGPCEGPLMVLHTKEEQSQMEVGPGLYVSTEAESVTWLVENDAEPLKFFAGYSGWGPGQLESELAEKAWLVVQADAERLFEPTEDLWIALMKVTARRIRYPQVTDKTMPGDPSVN